MKIEISSFRGLMVEKRLRADQVRLPCTHAHHMRLGRFVRIYESQKETTADYLGWVVQAAKKFSNARLAGAARSNQCYLAPRPCLKSHVPATKKVPVRKWRDSRRE